MLTANIGNYLFLNLFKDVNDSNHWLMRLSCSMAGEADAQLTIWKGKTKGDKRRQFASEETVGKAQVPPV